MSDILQAALRYAQAGIHVFPAKVAIVEGKKVVKPAESWRKTSTTDPAVIETWWRPGSPWEHASIAIDCGKSKLVVIDPDGAEGIANWRKLVGEHRIPATYRAATPGGGEHWYYRESPNRVVGIDSTGKVALHVDVRGMGGFVIAPPSLDERGMYRWLEGEPEWHALALVPDLVADRMNAKAEKVKPAEVPWDGLAGDPFFTNSLAPRTYTHGQAVMFCLSAMDALRHAPDGQINHRLNVAALTLGHFVPEFWTRKEARGWLLDALGDTVYDGKTWKAEDTIASGFTAADRDWKAVRVAEPDVSPAQVVEASLGEERLSTLEKLRRKLVSASDLAAQNPPEPLVWGLLDLDTESWLIGAPGSLKSFVALDLAGHVGIGRDWQGHKVKRSKVLYVAAEGARGLVLRARAWEKVNGPMGGVIFLPYPVQVASSDGQWAALVEIAREIEPGLIIIDTQARVTVGLEENSAKDMGVLTNAVGMLKRATGACVLVVHHTGRNGGDARGSSALDGAQDTELKVVRAEPRSSLKCKIRQDKQKDMAEGDEGHELRFQIVDLGVDPVTERELSSLVLMDRDTYRDAEGVTVSHDPRQPWLPEFHQLDQWRRKLLDALFVFAPDRGMTKPDLDRVMRKHWDDYNPSAGGPKRAWRDLLTLTDPTGEKVVAILGGERYGVISLLVRSALEAELPSAKGGGGVPGLPVDIDVSDLPGPGLELQGPG